MVGGQIPRREEVRYLGMGTFPGQQALMYVLKAGSRFSSPENEVFHLFRFSFCLKRFVRDEISHMSGRASLFFPNHITQFSGQWMVHENELKP